MLLGTTEFEITVLSIFFAAGYKLPYGTNLFRWVNYKEIATQPNTVSTGIRQLQDSRK